MSATDNRSWKLAAALPALLLSACMGDTLVREPVVPDRLNAVPDRISDEAIRADRSVIERLRTRLRVLNETGRWPLGQYHVCKAQAWIDFAETEYTDNDRGGVIEAALSEAGVLIGKMESDTGELPMETPVLPQSMVVRRDLWDFVAARKRHGLEHCVECDLAKLEVQLVAAGHDHKELGWRHAASGVMAAERHRRAIDAGPQACAATAVAAGGAGSIGPVAASAIGVTDSDAPRTLSLPLAVHFAYDQSRLGNETAAVLARVAWVMREHPQIEVELVGHTDPRGGNPYNDALGERRAQAVRAYLLASGIGAERIRQDSQGKRRLLDAGAADVQAYAMERRVELVFSGLPDIGTERQLLDLQPDR